MDKQYILEAIIRTAKANGGRPVGLARFCEATGIREFDWRGKYWLNFGDAQEEAGFVRNIKQGAYEEEWLLEKFIALIREIKRFHTVAALRMKRRADPAFPAAETFVRFGRAKKDRIAKIRAYSNGRIGYEDVLTICEVAAGESETEEIEKDAEQNFGFVYLMRSGRYYKIGRGNHVGGRERDLKIQLPDKVNTVHAIRTEEWRMVRFERC